jgi:hypothetical protein
MKMKVLADGRVRRTSSEWKKIIDRQGKSGLSIQAFCEKEEVSRGAFATWKRRLRGSHMSRKRPEFVEVTRPTRASPLPSLVLSEGTSFELAFPGGVTLCWKG